MALVSSIGVPGMLSGPEGPAVSELHVAVLIQPQFASDPIAPPHEQAIAHRECDGRVIDTLHPSVARTCNTLLNGTVGLPASRSTMKRRPIPEPPVTEVALAVGY
jgi:hypothetical protein